MIRYVANFSYSIALLILLGFAAVSAQAQVISERSELKLLTMLENDDMTAVHTHAKEILSKCQFPECVIVSLGTTNTLVDSFLRYYLKGDADRAIHYVPVRRLRATLASSLVLKRALPEPAPELRQVLFVRALESGLTVATFADAVTRHYAESKAPYEFEAFFSAADKFAEISESLKKDGFAGLAKFPWPYELKELPNLSALTGSYRDIDDDYYRFEPIIFSSYDFMMANKTHPRVQEFKRLVERSVGFDKSAGPKLFELTDEIREAWEVATSSDSYSIETAFLGLPNYLDYEGEAKRIYYAARTALGNELFAEFNYQENPRHKILDQVVKLFIENPEHFALKKCAALTTSQ